VITEIGAAHSLNRRSSLPCVTIRYIDVFGSPHTFQLTSFDTISVMRTKIESINTVPSSSWSVLGRLSHSTSSSSSSSNSNGSVDVSKADEIDEKQNDLTFQQAYSGIRQLTMVSFIRLSIKVDGAPRVIKMNINGHTTIGSLKQSLHSLHNDCKIDDIHINCYRGYPPPPKPTNHQAATTTTTTSDASTSSNEASSTSATESLPIPVNDDTHITINASIFDVKCP
jgi:hypothetical protein